MEQGPQGNPSEVSARTAAAWHAQGQQDAPHDRGDRVLVGAGLLPAVHPLLEMLKE